MSVEHRRTAGFGNGQREIGGEPKIRSFTTYHLPTATYSDGRGQGLGHQSPVPRKWLTDKKCKLFLAAEAGLVCPQMGRMLSRSCLVK